MAFFPVSIFFEVVLMALAIMFMQEGFLRKLIATGMWSAILLLILQKQVFIIENAGILSVSTIGYPTAIVSVIAPLIIFIAFVSALLAWQGRNMV